MGLQSPQSAFLHHTVRDCISLNTEMSRDNNPALLCDGHPSPLPQRRNVPVIFESLFAAPFTTTNFASRNCAEQSQPCRVQRSRHLAKE